MADQFVSGRIVARPQALAKAHSASGICFPVVPDHSNPGIPDGLLIAVMCPDSVVGKLRGVLLPNCRITATGHLTQIPVRVIRVHDIMASDYHLVEFVATALSMAN